MTTWDIAAGVIIGGAVLSLFGAGVRCIALDHNALGVSLMLAASGLAVWIVSQANFTLPL
jgi:ABC-type uncharacterized transport system permease subunit